MYYGPFHTGCDADCAVDQILNDVRVAFFVVLITRLSLYCVLSYFSEFIHSLFSLLVSVDQKESVQLLCPCLGCVVAEGH